MNKKCISIWNSCYEWWSNHRSPMALDMFILMIIFLPLYLMFLSNRPFATPDEARYVEIPREILLYNDWVTPRLNGVKYFEKPPLLYWLLAVIQKYFGMTETLMRIPICLFGFFGISSCYVFGAKVFNRRTGLVSAIILATTILWYSLSRLIILDMAVSSLITATLFFIYVGILDETPSRRKYLLAAAVMCAFGVLTKGIMVLALTGAIVVIWVSLSKNWSRLLPLYLPTNILVFLCIAAPWHILAALKNPEFLHKYFIVEHFMRYTTTIHMRYQPAWFFIPILVAGFLPWTGFTLTASIDVFKKMRSYRFAPQCFLMIWAIFVFVFFSFSSSKLIPYILPVFPPLALLTGHWIVSHIENTPRLSECLPSIIISGTVAFTIFFIVCFAKTLNITEITKDQSLLLPYLYIFLGIFAGMFLLSVFIRSYKLSYHLTLCISSGIILMCVAQHGAIHVQKPSMLPLIQFMKPYQSDNDILVSYETYHQDIAVYTKKKITVVGYTGELDFGTTVEDTRDWIVSHDEFYQKIKGNRRSVYWVFLRYDRISSFKKHFPDVNFEQKLCHEGLCLLYVHQ